MITIVQQLKIKEFPFEIKDPKGNIIYFEESTGYWYKKEFNSDGKNIYHENSNGYWNKSEYGLNGEEIYYETSKGMIIDNRPKPVELSMNDIAEMLGVDVNLLKIKK